MTSVLIAVPFLLMALILLSTAARTPEYRWLTLGVGSAALVVGGYAAWHAWFAPPAPISIPAGRPVTTPGSDTLPASIPVVAQDEDTPERMITKLGCGVCHQIPGILTAQSGVEGPLLLPKVTAERRMASPAYQAAVRSGRASARSPEEYIRESVLRPSAFIVPGFEQRERPDESTMPAHFKATFTVAGLDKLVRYLVSLDCADAARDNLKGPRVEPIDRLCGG
ncbi:MAG: hypothetical protein ACOYXR_03660 [Nitrospirota bacterium]